MVFAFHLIVFLFFLSSSFLEGDEIWNWRHEFISFPAIETVLCFVGNLLLRYAASKDSFIIYKCERDDEEGSSLGRTFKLIGNRNWLAKRFLK